MILINCVASWPGLRSEVEIASICSFIVFGTAAWKFMPVIGPEVIPLVENRAVTLTTFGFVASLLGVNASVRPDDGDVYAVIDFGCEGAAWGAGDEEDEENRSAGIADDAYGAGDVDAGR